MISKKISPPNCDTCDNKDSIILCSMNKSELAEFSKTKSFNVYKKGQIIFYEGNQPHGLFCIKSGKVKVHKMGGEGDDQIVRFVKPGGLLGYRALLSNEPYKASATALENTLICYIPKNDFIEQIKKNGQLSMLTIQMLTNDLKAAEKRILNMAQKPVRERIAEALLLIKECYGLENDEQTIAAILTRREIGDVAGVTTETTIRTLSEFKAEKIIKLDGKKIKILNMSRLVKLANIID
ncbi:MAG: Crp/Fnr family transcriptional regulator [Bacteroidetes bacterium]|nr:Crp/Fnr family transcriptional regulator [Bacteroidota bacterium]MBV6462253.1 Anaerobic regulatory protein [Flavobacteriales bacterium]WKZ74837.1 MAG: Crp/Fnr family transcriptional regulator [Vicingaceae bacterium]MCL4816059.1 Crp/Fnr family transcriptional regulator [Flavobacteriales bacterium]NOG95218.1 Crp/Fnr family transcriptional regulator [Bacteroidota bacterium]